MTELGMAFATLIAGPTASGKSALAMAWAEATGGIVVNADSMQVYADLRVLSARPDAFDEARVPHRLYGFVPAREEYSVGRFLGDIAPLISEARAGGSPLVIVGGTGLYFRALSEGLVCTPDIPPELRAAWLAQAAAGCDLHAELHRRDPARAAVLNPADTPRLLRAIEVFEATGRPFSDWLRAHPGTPLLAGSEWRGVFLDPPREVVRQAIDGRFARMMDAGALEEVVRLDAIGPALAGNRGVMKAHGVPHLAAHLHGAITREEAIRRGQADTRAYARRQVVFARKYLAEPRWHWSAAADAALAWLSAR